MDASWWTSFLGRHTILEILQLLPESVERSFSREDRRTLGNLISRISTLDRDTQMLVRRAGEANPGSKRPRPAEGSRATRGPQTKRRKLGCAPVVTEDGTTAMHSQAGHSSGAAPGGLAGPASTAGDVETLIDGEFLSVVPQETVESCISRFIDKTSNEAMHRETCMVCSRRLFMDDLLECKPDDLPAQSKLVPSHPHPHQRLLNGCLLDTLAVSRSRTYVCRQCHACLVRMRRPPLSLANNMWLGDIPFSLRILTLAERLLVSLHFPVAYVVKLYSKDGSPEITNGALRGNVSTYRLNTASIIDVVGGNRMPQPSRLLASTIAVTFIGRYKKALTILPRICNVRRQRVRDALVWLKSNNPLYRLVEIGDDRLEELPTDGVPAEIIDNVRISTDTESLSREHSSYVPDQDASEDTEEVSGGGWQDIQSGFSDAIRHPDDVLAASETEKGADLTVSPSRQRIYIALIESEPVVFSLRANGVMDVGAESVTEADLFGHSIENMLPPPDMEWYGIRRGDAFVNEYARVDDKGERCDGGPSNPNHLLGAFPILFPYGRGGFEVAREVNVTFEAHSSWALEIEDPRFRKDLYFAFQLFSIEQKRRSCRASRIQAKRSVWIKNEAAISALGVKDFIQATKEEFRRVPFSNPHMRMLRQQITTVRASIPGTDESRVSIRAQIWGMTMRYNPPNLWVTVNPSDSGDPVAQVLAGKDIDLDRFEAATGPTSTERTALIASDPVAAAQFFHLTVQAVLSELFGITRTSRGSIQRTTGIVGKVNGYIGTVEAQGRGTLHFHLLLWLAGSPTASVMKSALARPEFRQKLTAFIDRNIKADIDGMTKDEQKNAKAEFNISFSRPPDPRKADYARLRDELEKRVAIATQRHDCKAHVCLIKRGGSVVCKRRAPWKTAPEAWVNEDGDWGPKRKYGNMNAWNPGLQQATRCNQDMKLITNGAETKDITFYITLYIAKKQIQAANASALLAKAFYFARSRSRPYSQASRAEAAAKDNERLLVQCVNTLTRQQEMSAPEVASHLLGYGDRYISHTYVKINWTEVTASIRRTRDVLPETDSNMTVAADIVDDDPACTIQRENGRFVLKEQLKDYRERGRELDNMSLYDFTTQTYDGPCVADQPAHPTSPHSSLPAVPSRGRPPMRRVPYLQEANRKTCRVFRGANHETNIHFVGQWFPRDTDERREYYCAQILVLFSPWRRLDSVSEGFPTMEAKLQDFRSRASRQVLDMIENIQYFHDSADSARRRRDVAASSGADEDPVSVEEQAELGLMHNLMEEMSGTEAPVHLQEEDVEAAREGRLAPRERVFGEGAMIVAEQMGIFDFPEFAPPRNMTLKRSTPQLTALYQEWGKTVAAFSRRTDFRVQNPVDNVAAAPVQQTQTLSRQSLAVAPPSVFTFGPSYRPVRTAEQAAAIATLNVEQRRAHDIIESHLVQTLSGRNPKQLLMIVQGEGGTGKTVLLNAISHTFDFMTATNWLAKTATTGVASSLIKGCTLHTWAGIPVRAKADPGDEPSGTTRKIQRRRVKNILPTRYLVVDEFSMLTKSVLARLSQITGKVKAGDRPVDATVPFGGINVILFGDPHQFPPAGNPTAALYHSLGCDSTLADAGRNLYLQFRTVITLREQRRVTDEPWMNLLRRLRTGDCTEDDIKMVDSLLVGSRTHEPPDWNAPPWSEAILVTPRHSARLKWNAAALHKHSVSTGNPIYMCPAEDIQQRDSDMITLSDRVAIAGMSLAATGRLEERIELSVGMKAMVMLNIATEADLANGTRGTVEDIVLDHREPEAPLLGADGRIMLQFPPALVTFKPDAGNFPEFPNIPAGSLPIVPSEAKFSTKGRNSLGSAVKVTRRQFAIAPGYAFTDFKSQGQTIGCVFVDLERPPTGSLTPFSAYVALSRSRGRHSIRLLRGFDEKLFTTHPSEHLRIEDQRLDRLEEETRRRFEQGTVF